jgi:hypothetical protein
MEKSISWVKLMVDLVYKNAIDWENIILYSK